MYLNKARQMLKSSSALEYIELNKMLHTFLIVALVMKYVYIATELLTNAE